MSVDNPFAAELGRNVTTLCHCWQVRRVDGLVAGFTDHDRVLVFDGVEHEPEAGFTASEAVSRLGLAGADSEIDGALRSARISDQDIDRGLYDGAVVSTHLVDWRDPTKRKLLRNARIARIARREGGFTAELETGLRSLERVTGRVIRRTCDAALGDARCGVDLETPDFSASFSVTAVDAAGSVTVSGLDGAPERWFEAGTVTWATGARSGRTDRIDRHATEAGLVRLVLSTTDVEDVQPGDTGTARAGCDKRFRTCREKFANSSNFRGFPHLPGNDAAYAYVTEGGRFDGGPIVP